MGSGARSEGVCNYSLWTTKELIGAYAEEKTRINGKDRKQSQDLIRESLRERFRRTLELLDDGQTEQNPEGACRYLLGE